MAEHREFRRIQLGAGPVDVGQLVVCVDFRAGVTGKMFAATGDPLGP